MKMKIFNAILALFLSLTAVLTATISVSSSTPTFVASASWAISTVAPGMTDVPITITVTNEGPYAVYNVTVTAVPSYPFCGEISQAVVSYWPPGQSITLTGYLSVSPSASPGVYSIPVYIGIPGSPYYSDYQATAEVAVNGYVNLTVPYATITGRQLVMTIINTGNVQSGLVNIYFYNTSAVKFLEGQYVLTLVQPSQEVQVSVPIEVSKPLGPGVYYLPVRLDYMRGSHYLQVPALISSNSTIVYSLTGTWAGKYAVLTLVYSSPYNVSAVRVIGYLPQGWTNYTGGSEIYVTLPLTYMTGAIKFNVYFRADSSVYTIPMRLDWFTDKGVLTEEGNLTLYVYQEPQVEIVSVEGILFAGAQGNITITVRNVGDASAYNLTATENTLPFISSTALPYLAPGSEGNITVTVLSPYSEAGKSVETNITVLYMTSQGTVDSATVPVTFTVYQPTSPIAISDPSFTLVAGIDNQVAFTVTNNLGFTIYDVTVSVTPSQGSVIGQSQLFIGSLQPKENANVSFVIDLPSSASGTLVLAVDVSYVTPFGTNGSYTTTITYQVVSMSNMTQDFELNVTPSVVQYGRLSPINITITSYFGSTIRGATVELSSPNGYVSPSTQMIPELEPFGTTSVKAYVEFVPPSNGSTLLEPIKVTVRFYYDGTFLNFTKTVTVLAIGKPVLIISGLSYAVVQGNSSEVTAGVSFEVGNSGSGNIPSVTIVPLPPPGIALVSPSVVGISDLQPSESEAVSFTVVGKPGNYTIPLRIIYATPLGQEVTENYNITVSLSPPTTTTTSSTLPPILYNPLLPVVVALLVVIIILLRRGRK